MDTIENNLNIVLKEINSAFLRRKKDNGAVSLVAVSKFQPVELLQSAVAAGAVLFGESRVQEACAKREIIGTAVQWHMIGHLQTNKARQAVGCFDMIQSVDSERLLLAINNEACRAGKVQQLLLQVNIAGEEAKHGATPLVVQELLALSDSLPNVRVCGLMTITPDYGENALIRADYAKTAALFEKMRAGRENTFTTLSMGMSGDFAIAIEEGANMVRVGTAIFGARQ